MQLEELHNIARLLDSHTMISYITRLHDNIIMLRLDTTNYCFDLNKGNPQIYILENPLKNKNYIAPFDNVLHKYFYKSHLQSCKLDGMNKILIIESETKNAYKTLHMQLHIELISRATNAIVVHNGAIISALRFHTLHNREITAKAKFAPMPQPHFSKKLQDNDICDIRKKLLQNYVLMQDSIVEQKRKIVCHTLTTKLHKLQSILHSLPNVETLEKQKNETTMLANYVLMHLSDIPKYATTIQVNGICYPIPQEKKASMISDKLFKRVKKLKQKILHSNLQRQNLESKIAFLHNQITFAKHATLEQLAILHQRKKDSKKECKKYYESFYIDGIRISIGKNEKENIKLLQDAKADFIWLHIFNVPSSHLIIHTHRINSTILEHAGILLARLCGIQDGKITIDYTKRKFVKIIQGANVIYSKESKLHLTL